VNQALADSFGLDRPEGALVSAVVPGSAAAAAGLKPGDVIRAVDGQTVVASGDLPAIIGRAQPGDSVKLTVLRQGKSQTLSARLDERKATQTAEAEDDTPAANQGRLGLALRPIAPQERAQGAPDNGLVVEQATGPAAKAGLRPGDVVLAVNGTPAESVDQVRETVGKAGSSVALLIARGGQRIFVPVRLG
jgi:serine protease Do